MVKRGRSGKNGDEHADIRVPTALNDVARELGLLWKMLEEWHDFDHVKITELDVRVSRLEEQRAIEKS